MNIFSMAETATASFRWEVDEQALQRPSKPLTSPTFHSVEKTRWRGLLDKCSFSLQLESAVNLVNAEFR